MLYWDEQLKSNWGTICTLIEMEAADGKRRKVQGADTKGLSSLTSLLENKRKIQIIKNRISSQKNTLI